MIKPSNRFLQNPHDDDDDFCGNFAGLQKVVIYMEFYVGVITPINGRMYK